MRQATEDTLLDIAGHLPEEAQQALLSAAVGERPEVRVVAEGNPFSHPDAQRRFRVIGDEVELRAALEAPWDDWAIFLHPAQREFVDRDFSGPARVIGSAGTGKTVVALHRAVRLAENPEARVLLTTFNEALADGLAKKLARLTAANPEVASRITVGVLADIARKLADDVLGMVDLAAHAEIDALLDAAMRDAATDISPEFLREEWRLVVDAWNITDRDAYMDLPRLGRKTRLVASRRDELWAIFQHVRESLRTRSQETEAMMMHRLAANLTAPPFTNVLVDEAQDISVPELRLLAAMAGDRQNGLFFAGDIGQRIFRSAFPWKAVGVEIQGRSRSLKVNYRTSHQIRAKSDLLLPIRLLEADGGEDRRTGVSSVFDGPAPDIRIYPSKAEEIEGVGHWLRDCRDAGLAGDTIAVLVRSSDELTRAMAAIAAGGDADTSSLLMHEAKGREFRAVAVMACDETVLPSQNRLLTAHDERSHKEVYDTERHLLYVAATRSRERLMISGCDPVSGFLDDLLDQRV